ncbi:MAG TPA: gliding motility-associated ABC transporter ATP-binding subunit GldA [Cyclobacteriaceae bacterium]|nr:gliding motility-associated ABC transporter ATP-binding subunit GldA [Cyclobacteriaceae bacterium]HRJ81072.1 gliding motility-associated ABC transporter ATP-binding subunit GldA [Cyclobacteriaceae bacterium]
MSLSVQHLTKLYGQQRAVDNISFEVGEGEIVGFLGPNGAGKSTTMKIATTYLPPSAGKVTVGGWDVTEYPMQVKQVIGYLPEHNPLYLDMYVHEYLRFIGSLYGLRGKNLKQQVGEMVERCGLEQEQHKKIEMLSKGYRQRVGLAQALIHNPKVLILDEPTSGLDPNQLVEIRKLIKDVSADKTVIFSTHIMQEVQALCDRVIVINKGSLVADDQLNNLLGKGGSSTVVLVEFDQPVGLDDLRAVHGVVRVDSVTPSTLRLVSDGSTDIRPEIFKFAAQRNIALLGLKVEENSLEHIFRSLTTKPAEV